MAARHDDRVLRVWSAACSSGQEPYSIAMVAGDQLAAAHWRLDVTATDLSQEMLDRATVGRFSQLEMNRGLPVTQLVRWFNRVGAEWEVKEDLRRSIRFSRVNLAAPFNVGGPFDIVFLRNVLIYFDATTKRDILRRVARTMRPGGWLVLGAAETTLGIDDSWERRVIGRATAYRQTPTHLEGR
jgi:chemotaxis protein methyltransferase CheR